MKVLAAVLVCLFILITSSEEIQHSAARDRQKRLNLPDIDVS